MEGESQSSIISLVKRILCYAHSLTTHTPSAKGPTLNWYLSVRFGRASFADQTNNRTEHLHRAYFVIVMLLLWLLESAGEMVGSVVLNVLSSGLCRSFLAVFRQVAALLYKMFAVVVTCIKMEYQREAITEDQGDMNIAKIADGSDEIEHVCLESSIRRIVGLLEVSENTYSVSLYTTGCKGDDQRLPLKDGDCQLTSSNVEDSYFNGRGHVGSYIDRVRSRYCIFVSGRCERSTRWRRRRYRSRAPSRVCSRLKVIMQKNKKIRRLFKRVVLGAVPKSSTLYKLKNSCFRKENLYLKYFVSISTRRKKKKKIK